jgi:hypothetical protein
MWATGGNLGKPTDGGKPTVCNTINNGLFTGLSPRKSGFANCLAASKFVFKRGVKPWALRVFHQKVFYNYNNNSNQLTSSQLSEGCGKNY